ncbi:aromatic acid exporter family protein [uncultured Microbacterium sp.]|uniref:FUSC family protein n=1 Tax=uncultured Microbacterium sp. TaxID=191216 RepID=UPI0026099F7B|nr:FUSC family protein [uncultured Microbacterium sp.]
MPLLHGGREIARADRLILAAKAAAAAALAWYTAPLIPLAQDEYSYYAPLGVIISMHATVAASARAGAQTLVGLGTGVALGLGALGLVFSGLPAIIAIALVIAAGILLGGIPALGAGQEWVPIAGVFVLLLGGANADEFSLSYLVTTAFGIVIGVAVNLLIIPPLHIRRADLRLSALRDEVSTALDEVADAINRTPPDAEALRNATRRLPWRRDEVAINVKEAEDSSRGNPRARRRRAERDMVGSRMHALDATTRAVSDLSDGMLSAIEEDRVPTADVREALSASVRAASALVGAPADDERAAGKLGVAERALQHAMTTMNASSSPGDAIGHAYAAAMSVRRIIRASEDFVSAHR